MRATRRTQREDTGLSLGRAPVSDLNRGRQRLSLIRDLAMGEWSHQSIAKKLGCSTQDVRDFAERYSNDIAEVRMALAGELAIETAGLWITRRQNRLAEIQADFEEIEDVLDDIRAGTYKATDNDGRNLGSRRHRALVKAKLELLKAAADELSPRNQTAGGSASDPNVVHYVINAGPLKDSLT